MKTKTNAEMLKSIRQYNKTEREKKALKEGFATAALFITFLENQISLGFGAMEFLRPTVGSSAPSEKKTSPIKTKVIGDVPTIHVADVLDSSGSMAGGKIAAAIKGINIGVEGLKSDKEKVNYTYTLCDFSDSSIFRHITAPLSQVEVFKGHTRGSTSLYDAIGDTISHIKDMAKPEDKVLVNIYTDGEENSSRRYRAEQIAGLISELSEKGWTFTFIGTQRDVEFAQSKLKFDMSNTLVHDNTARGMGSAFTTNSVARSAYSSKVSKGEDVKTGFYKDIK
jgi:uncharacterized protein YegL